MTPIFDQKSAYLAAARKAHPDVSGGNDKKFKQVQRDYEMAEDLMDMHEGKVRLNFVNFLTILYQKSKNSNFMHESVLKHFFEQK